MLELSGSQRCGRWLSSPEEILRRQRGVRVPKVLFGQLSDAFTALVNPVARGSTTRRPWNAPHGD